MTSGAAREPASDRRLAVLAIAASVALVTTRVASGFDPPALWLDDLWVALAVRELDLSGWLSIGPPIPFGFAALLGLSTTLSNDPEWPLQLIPIACLLLLIPTLAWLTRRTTGSWMTGAAAAALIASSPGLVGYAVHVKQYSADALATVVLLLVGLPLLDRGSTRRAIATGAAALVALVFSFASAFVSLALLHLAALRRALATGSTRRERAVTIVVALVYDTVLLGLYATVFSQQASPEMHAYWDGFFVPLDGPAAVGSFLDVAASRVALSLLPPGAPPVLLLLIVPALVVLLATPKSRGAGSLAATVYLGLGLAAAARLHPLGTGRTEIFSHPISIWVIVVALDGVFRKLGAERIGRGVLAAGSLGVLVFWGARGDYFPAVDYVGLIEEVERADAAGDSTLVFPHASFSLAYYTSWSVELRSWPHYAHGFSVAFPKRGVTVLPGHSAGAALAASLAADVRTALPQLGSRVVYYTTHEGSADAAAVEVLVAAGYLPTGVERAPGASLHRFARGPKRARIEENR